MRSRKGISLIEILAVLVMVLLLILLVSFVVIDRIDEARGATLMADARTVHIIAQTVIYETIAENIKDRDYAEGLSGFYDDPSKPIRTELSRRMRTRLEPDIVLAETPDEHAATAKFEIENGEIVGLTYSAMVGNKQFEVVLAGGEATVTRVKTP